MKNIGHYIFSAVVLLLAMASCQKFSGQEGSADQTESVRIALTSPTPVTKAIGDGTKAKVAYYTAFVNGEVVKSLSNQVELDADGCAVLDLKLVKNVTYSFVFWAQALEVAGQEAYYDLSTFYVDSKVKVNYDVKANDDLRDAFCAMKEIYVTGPVDETVYLRRPFAQINFGASDYSYVKQLLLHTGMLSEMTVLGIPDTITVLDGSVSSSAGVPADVVFDFAAIPSGEDEYLTVLGKQYGYVGMNYILAAPERQIVSVSGRFVNGDASWEMPLLTNVPVQSNYKTNILGDFFVEQGKFEIIVQPSFESPDNVVPIQ